MAGHTSVLSVASVSSVAWRVLPLLAATLLTRVSVSFAHETSPRCARLESGWACGVRRSSGNCSFVSFLGVPYARQPIGELRFQELQPLEPWGERVFEATEEGPICPQRDVFYGRIMQPKNTTLTEACIYANVHVPLHALASQQGKPTSEVQPPKKVLEDVDKDTTNPGLPIFVFVHGGGFASGSGGTDLHGPEYLIGQDVIIITFNYRLNVFGFMSLNNSYIPGNNGLRDIVTLLRWVRANALAFGGNPDDVTLAGHSAGAASVHLLTLSKAAAGLFKRSILMSGTALPTFYTTAPSYAQFVSKIFLEGLGIDSNDPEDIHRQLIDMPLEKIMQVYSPMIDIFGEAVFFPVLETSSYPNFTTILDDDPEALLVMGRGRDIPLIIGFTDAECYGFLSRFEQLDILTRIKENPIILTPPHLIYKRPPDVAMEIAKTIQSRYFHGEPTMDEYLKSCSEAHFIYPAMKVALIRATVGGAPVYLYEFSYQSQFSVKKEVDKINYEGAGHMDDLTYVFRVNSVLGPEDTFKPKKSDEDIKNWMVHFVMNFIKYSDPAADRPPKFATPWPALTKRDKKYQGINVPYYRTLELDEKQLEMLRFFDNLQNRTS